MEALYIFCREIATQTPEGFQQLACLFSVCSVTALSWHSGLHRNAETTAVTAVPLLFLVTLVPISIDSSRWNPCCSPPLSFQPSMLLACRTVLSWSRQHSGDRDRISEITVGM
jgi:hypothetical protein